MSITKENIDQWMFQNVEGELTSEQAEQLSSFIIANPNLEGDFEKWNEAHFKDIQIEEYKNLDSIIKKKRFVWHNRYTFLLGLFLGATFWIPFAFKGNNKIEDVKKVVTKPVLKQEHTEVILEVEITKVEQTIQLETKNIIVTNEMVENQDSKVLETENEIEIEQILSREVVSIEASSNRRKLNARRVFYRPEKTKKEKRFEKRRARREARKPEIKYIKGNGPGVIPMNDLGF